MQRLMLRIVLLIAVAIAVFEGSADAVVAGVLAVGAAAVMSSRLPSRAAFRLRPARLLLHLPWFTALAARGGVDVARRALSPGRSLQPGFVDYDVAIHDPVARVMFANAVSLMPGTFTARLEPRLLRVHVLDERVDVRPQLAALEVRVARVFGEELP
jgi:multicomponent Na+:H+ antiporter subunit E